MKKRVTKIELFKQAMNFSAGHFTIFSESERENLHGHNFSVYVMFEAEVMENGIAFNYNVYKKIILDICQLLDQVVLLPLKSPYLRIEESDEYISRWRASMRKRKRGRERVEREKDRER